MTRGRRQQRLRELRREMHAADPRCTYCRRFLTFERSTLDHVLPRRDGGRDAPPNLVLTCRECNTLKAGRTPEQLSAWVNRILRAAERLQHEASIVAEGCHNRTRCLT